MKSIKRLTDINTLRLYEAHLLWFDDIVMALKHMDMSKLPELHPGKCTVGKWITQDGDKVITDKVILDKFTRLHKNLHLVAKHIEFSFKTKPIDFSVLMLLLKKAELFSLSLGVELSIINNIRYQITASKDPLTGALNRQLLFHIFSTQFELSRAVEKGFCLVMTDLDDFKAVNDEYGHVEGDKVLSAFSAMIADHLRDSDFVIRYGGEEFLLILPSTSLENGVVLAEKLKEMTHTLHEKHDLKKSITGSFGVIEIVPESQETVSEELMSRYIQKVDKELYFAKEHGKDQVSNPNLHTN
jgi:diguanylate cyclase (GGDEF)-like protein